MKAAEGRGSAGAADVDERLGAWVHHMNSDGGAQVPGTVETDQRRIEKLN